MGYWPYRIILSVSDEELARRRSILDSRGQYAQISALLLLGVLFLYGVRGRHVEQHKRKTWWDAPAIRGGSETRKQYAVTLIWLAWLLTLSVWKTGDGKFRAICSCEHFLPNRSAFATWISANTYLHLEDYIHLTKALGHVGLSQLPFLVLLAPTSFLFTSNSTLPSIFSYLTSIPQPSLTAYHRLFGRVIVVPLVCSHAVLFLLFYIQVPHPVFGTVFAKRIRDSDVQFGLAGTLFSILILVLGRANVWRLRDLISVSRPEARRQIFYVVHLVLVAIFFTLAYSHVRYARPFVLEAIGASLANLACCKLLASRWRW